MVAPGKPPYVAESDIGAAYTALLESRVQGLCPYDYHIVHIYEPVSSIDYVEFSIERERWGEIVNAGDTLSRFESYEFHDGSTAYSPTGNSLAAFYTAQIYPRMATGLTSGPTGYGHPQIY